MQTNKGALKKPSRPDISSRKSTVSDAAKNKITGQARDPNRDRILKNKEISSVKKSTILTDPKASQSNRVKSDVKSSSQTALGTNNISSHSKINTPQTSSKTAILKPATTKQSQISSTIKNSSMKTRKADKDATSNRVTTTQYFPKKYYERQSTRVPNEVPTKTVIKKISPEKIPVSVKRERARKTTTVSDSKLNSVRSRSRTLSPSEIKIVKGPEDNPPKKNYVNDNDVRKLASIATVEPSVQGNISTKILSKIPSSKSPELKSNDDYNYEDDFDSYESDFEQCSSSNSSRVSSSASSTNSLSNMSSTTSSESSESEKNDSFQEMITSSAQKRIPNCGEEERKLDSGNYDLRDPKRLHMLHGIKEAIERENSIIGKQLNQERCEGSLSDEGFEEGAPKTHSATKHHFIDFSNARKKEQRAKYITQSKKRGQDILNMITLDNVYVSLFEMLPVPYEMYMQNYGRRDTVQVYCQTNDDDFTEEVQTDDIDKINKWTQHPIAFVEDCKTNDDLIILNRLQSGAGGDDFTNVQPEHWRNISKHNEDHLNSFMQSAGQVMFMLLDENNKSLISKQTNTIDLPFSAGFTDLGIDAISFLANRRIQTVEYSDEQCYLLLTVHEGNSDEFMSYEQELLSRPVICLWNIREPTLPLKNLFVSERITACCFNRGKSNFVYAGLGNGSVSVWDLRESSHLHTDVRDDMGTKWILRSPTYITVPVQEYSSQISEIVTVKCLLSSENEEREDETLRYTSPPRICTLNQIGHIIIWSVTHSQKSPSQITQDQGLAHWGNVRLVASISVNLTYLLPELDAELQCFDLQFDSEDPNNIYVTTNSGYVIHCLTSGMKTTPKLYNSNTDNRSHTTCIEVCPYRQPYFLVGCMDGSIRLHSRLAEKSLITLYGSDEARQNCSIKIIQWSKTKPCIIYTVDNDDIMHIWDLESSDIYPIMSIPLGDKVTGVKVLPCQNKKLNYMVLAFEKGRVQIHEIHTEFSFQSLQELNQELNKFVLYVNIL